MMFTWPPIDPFLTGFGMVTTNGVLGIQATWLFNDSQIYLLRVWQTSINGTFTNPAGFSLSNAVTGAGGKRGQPLVAGERVPPGMLVGGQVTVSVLQNFNNVLLWQDATLNVLLPLAILRPGWSYIISDGNSATSDSLNNAFYWDCVVPELFDRPRRPDTNSRP